MAGPIKLTEVDFEQIKENLISYLRSTKQFTDFDFSGSNLQVILNLISYQAQLNSYTANMVANESFLASATVRTNVVENANMLGYFPTSARCAQVVADLEFRLEKDLYPQGYPTYVEIKPGAVLSAGTANDTFYFNVMDSVIGAVVSNSGLVRFRGLQAYEGYKIEQTFTVDKTDFNQRFVLENERVDTTTLRVDVQEVGSSNFTRMYEPANNLVKMTSESRAYWIEETRDGFYELRFGDGFFGRELQDGAIITVKYIVTTGNLANGIQSRSKFSFVGKMVDAFGGVVNQRANIVAASMVSTGSLPETVDSIKLRAPRSYEAQNRCVTTDDYETIIRQVFPAVEDIYVYGGETLEEPQFGRVFISIKPTTGDNISSYTKNYIKKSLEPYRVASLDLRFIDPDVINVELLSTVYYDDRKTNKDETGITASVNDALTRFKDASTVSKFGGAVRYSTLAAIIDAAEPSITRNNTSFRLRKDVKPVINTFASYEVCFSNPLKLDCDNSILSSTGFRMEVNGVFDEKVYFMEDDSVGNIRVFYITENNRKVVTNNFFGAIDYETGDLLIGFETPIKIIDVTTDNSFIELRVIPREQDVEARESVFLNLDIAQSAINSLTDSKIAK